MENDKDQASISRLGPLSYGQRALWFLQQIAPHSVAYNVMLAACVNSEVDAPALQGAFQWLVERHSSLRTCFPSVKGAPVRQVQQHQQVYFKHTDVQALSWNELKRRLVEESHRPFDLEKGPLLRIDLFTRSSREHVLLLTVHHIVVDFLSFVIMLDDLRLLYPAQKAGEQAGLAPTGGEYSDYVAWQMKMLAGAEGERLWSYWQKQLSGDLPALNLPTDRPRRSVQTYRGATETLKLDGFLSLRLKSLAKAEGVSLYTLLLAAFQSLLHRYSGQPDVLVGSPPLGRRRPEMEGVVGFFHNPVVLRADFTGNPSFKTFLGQAHQRVLAAWEHQDYPFSLLVERLQPARDVSRSPLFQVMFVLYEAEGQAALPFMVGEAGARLNLGGLELEHIDLEQQVSMLDLTLTIVDAGDSLSTGLQYNSDLFDAATVARMLEHFECLLEAIVTNPQQRILDLPLVTRAERRAVSASEVLDPNGYYTKASAAAIDFSLFYFASDDDQQARGKYDLLFEGAKFADENGFSAVWTPERHFHRFGGLYPNPAITSAAIAAVTSRVRIRAGSIVLPLHNPIRVAEDWSVIDNISGGRVGLSVASGWHADDFVFAPGSYAGRRQVMCSHIETVRKLWRGETVSFPGGAGNQVQVKIMPRPVQPELPIWVTAFGSPETFQMAGEIGANMLTHLLGQSVELLAEKIAVYRSAYRRHSNKPGTGYVTLMLHTFVGEDYDAVREKVRGPFCNYLKSSLDLLIGLAQSAGLDVDPKHLTEKNIEALVAHAFDRYYESCGLFGTPDTCMKMIERLKAVGIDEVACLIDFGVDHESVLSGLCFLKALKDAANRMGHSQSEDFRAYEQAAGENLRPAHFIQETHSRAEMRRTLTARQQQIRGKHFNRGT